MGQNYIGMFCDVGAVAFENDVCSVFLLFFFLYSYTDQLFRSI